MAAIGFCLTTILHFYRQIIGKKQRKQANFYLRKTAPSIVKTFEQIKKDKAKEFSLDDLKRMRFLLDRMLQPTRNFDGFEWIDQFQTAAVRSIFKARIY